jgi:hypothetical protein
MLEGCFEPLVPVSSFFFHCKRSFDYYSDFGMSDGVRRGDIIYIRTLSGKAFFFFLSRPFSSKTERIHVYGKDRILQQRGMNCYGMFQVLRRNLYEPTFSMDEMVGDFHTLVHVTLHVVTLKSIPNLLLHFPVQAIETGDLTECSIPPKDILTCIRNICMAYAYMHVYTISYMYRILDIRTAEGSTLATPYDPQDEPL